MANAKNELGVFDEKKRTALVKKESRRILKIIQKYTDDNPNYRLEISQILIENAAFMSMMLTEAREKITKDGFVEEYKNGANQSGKKKSVASDVYDKTIINYTKLVSQLCNLIPENKDGALKELMEFVNSS